VTILNPALRATFPTSGEVTILNPALRADFSGKRGSDDS
jgi:hypothetical protein